MGNLLLRSLVGPVTLWMALGTAVPGAAASTVAIYWQPDGPSDFGLYVENSLGVPLGGVSILVEGATGFSLNAALPGVSPADSVYRIRPLDDVAWDALIVNNTALGVTLVPAGSTARLGSLIASTLFVTLLPGETIYPPYAIPAFGASFFDVSGSPILGRIDSILPPRCDQGECIGGNGFRITVPEPPPLRAAAALALLFCVLGENIRRRKHSGSRSAQQRRPGQLRR